MKKDFLQLNFLYIALLLGQILFCTVVFFLGTEASSEPEGAAALPPVLLNMAPVIILLSIAAAWYLNRQKMAEGASLQGPEEKFAHYRAAVIMRCALVEGANLFMIVLTLLTDDFTFLLYFAMGLLAFLYFRPAVDEFVQNYRLSVGEEAELRG